MKKENNRIFFVQLITDKNKEKMSKVLRKLDKFDDGSRECVSKQKRNG